MEAYLIYIAQSALCLVVLYLPFHFWIQKETFFRTNRYGLLGITFLSLLLPLISFPWLARDTYVNFPEIVVMGFRAKEPQTVPSFIDWKLTLLCVYLSGVIHLLIRKLRTWIRMMRFIRQGCLWSSKENGIHIYCHAHMVPPFSWMNNIIISEKDYRENGSIILLHETAHIRCHHSWDMLWLSVMETLQWFNPTVWMLTKDMQDIHEYEADHWVLSQGVNAYKYQMLLIARGSTPSSFELTNHFSKNLIKRRIQMINRIPSQRRSRMKYLYLIPFVAGAIWVNSPSNVTIQQENGERPAETLKFIARNIKYPTSAIEEGIEGKVILEVQLDKEGSIQTVKILKGIDQALDDEALRVIRKMPKWTQESNGYSKYLVPIDFKL